MSSDGRYERLRNAGSSPHRIALGQSRVQRGCERAAAAVGRAAGRPSAARLAVVCGDRDEGGGGVAVVLACVVQWYSDLDLRGREGGIVQSVQTPA